MSAERWPTLGPVTVRDYIPVLVERQARLTLADVRDPAAP